MATGIGIGRIFLKPANSPGRRGRLLVDYCNSRAKLEELPERHGLTYARPHRRRPRLRVTI